MSKDVEEISEFDGHVECPKYTYLKMMNPQLPDVGFVETRKLVMC